MHSHHINERDVNEKTGSNSENPLRRFWRIAEHNAQTHPEEAQHRAKNIVEYRLLRRHACLQQHSKIAQLMRKLVTKNCNCRTKAARNVVWKRRANSHSIGEIVQAIAQHHHPYDRREWFSFHVKTTVTMTVVLVAIL